MIRRVLSAVAGFGFRPADDDDEGQVVSFELDDEYGIIGAVPPRTIRFADLVVEPSLTERERLMRHTGRPECPIPEHADALRRHGQLMIERDEARRLLGKARNRLTVALAEVARLNRKVEYLESRLNHPARGQPGSTPPPDLRPPPPSRDPDPERRSEELIPRSRPRGQEAA